MIFRKLTLFWALALSFITQNCALSLKELESECSKLGPHRVLRYGIQVGRFKRGSGFCDWRRLDDDYYYNHSNVHIKHTVQILSEVLEVAPVKSLLWDKISSIQELDLSMYPDLVDISPLVGLFNLRKLRVHPDAQINSLAPLTVNSQFARFDIGSSHRDENDEFIKLGVTKKFTEYLANFELIGFSIAVTGEPKIDHSIIQAANSRELEIPNIVDGPKWFWTAGFRDPAFDYERDKEVPLAERGIWYHMEGLLPQNLNQFCPKDRILQL